MKPEVNRPLRSLFIARRTERGRGGDFSGGLTIPLELDESGSFSLDRRIGFEYCAVREGD